MKEIWKKFKEECSIGFSDMVDGIKGICRTTWELFKDTCVKFVEGIFTWLKELAGGVIVILIGFIEVVWAAFVAFVKAIFDLLYNKIIKFIMKW